MKRRSVTQDLRRALPPTQISSGAFLRHAEVLIHRPPASR